MVELSELSLVLLQTIVIGLNLSIETLITIYTLLSYSTALVLSKDWRNFKLNEKRRALLNTCIKVFLFVYYVYRIALSKLRKMSTDILVLMFHNHLFCIKTGDIHHKILFTRKVLFSYRNWSTVHWNISDDWLTIQRC